MAHDLLTKIGTTNGKIPSSAIAVFGIFPLLLLGIFLLTGERNILVWSIPLLILLLVIPLSRNYMSQSQYSDLAPMYGAEAKNVRIKMMNESMIGQLVCILGLVNPARFQFLNRP